MLGGGGGDVLPSAYERAVRAMVDAKPAKQNRLSTIKGKEPSTLSTK